MELFNNAGVLTIQIDPDYGDGDGRIITDELQIKGGSDFAEYFNINAATVRPGMVVSIDPNQPGQLKIATSPYDKKVAGIVSGANGIKPGLSMYQEETIAEGEYPVALTGRVFVLTTDENGPIEPGDFLTSSSKPGYAMKADDPVKAFGSIVGKAMTARDKKSGYVLCLINLQ